MGDKQEEERCGAVRLQRQSAEALQIACTTEKTMYNPRNVRAGNPGVVHDSEHPEPIVERASSKLRNPGRAGPYAATKPKARSTMGFLLCSPHTCGTSVACADQTLTRASQRGHGGLRIEPGGNGVSFAKKRLYAVLSLFNAMRRHGSGKHTKARAVSLRYGSALLKQSPVSINKETVGV